MDRCVLREASHCHARRPQNYPGTGPTGVLWGASAMSKGIVGFGPEYGQAGGRVPRLERDRALMPGAHAAQRDHQGGSPDRLSNLQNSLETLRG